MTYFFRGSGYTAVHAISSSALQRRSARSKTQDKVNMFYVRPAMVRDARLVRNVVHHDRRRRSPVVHGCQAAVSFLAGRIPNLELDSRVIQLHLLRQECRCGGVVNTTTKHDDHNNKGTAAAACWVRGGWQTFTCQGSLCSWKLDNIRENQINKAGTHLDLGSRQHFGYVQHVHLGTRKTPNMHVDACT